MPRVNGRRISESVAGASSGRPVMALVTRSASYHARAVSPPPKAIAIVASCSERSSVEPRGDSVMTTPSVRSWNRIVSPGEKR
jgi:hypothetical protein